MSHPTDGSLDPAEHHPSDNPTQPVRICKSVPLDWTLTGIESVLKIPIARSPEATCF